MRGSGYRGWGDFPHPLSSISRCRKSLSLSFPPNDYDEMAIKAFNRWLSLVVDEIRAPWTLSPDTSLSKQRIPSCLLITQFRAKHNHLAPIINFFSSLLQRCFLSGKTNYSSVTLFTAIFVTFVLAVMMTAVTFVCCRRFWKNRESLEIEETHSYRLANETFHHSHPISPFESLDPERLQASSGNCTSIETYLPLSSYIDPHNSIAFIEPPPPYHVNPVGNVSHSSPSDRLFAVIGAPLRRGDVIYPTDGRKRLWRTLSQWWGKHGVLSGLPVAKFHLSCLICA